MIKWSNDGVRRVIEERMFCWLKDREIEILKNRYGLWGGRVWKIREIASNLDLSPARIGQIQKKAERKLHQRMAARVLAGRLLEKYEDQIGTGEGSFYGALIYRMLKAII